MHTPRKFWRYQTKYGHTWSLSQFSISAELHGWLVKLNPCLSRVCGLCLQLAWLRRDGDLTCPLLLRLAFSVYNIKLCLVLYTVSIFFCLTSTLSLYMIIYVFGCMSNLHYFINVCIQISHILVSVFLYIWSEFLIMCSPNLSLYILINNTINDSFMHTSF